MKAKYLGRFEVNHELLETTFNHEDDDSIWYKSEQFVRCGSMWQPKSELGFDGIADESNTSSIALKLSPCGEQAKLWRIW